MKKIITLLSWAISLGSATQTSACSTPGPVQLSYAVENAALIVAGTITGQSGYQRTFSRNSEITDVSTVVFEVDVVLRGDAAAAREFTAIGNSDMIARNLGQRFVVALIHTDREIFVPDVRFGDTAELPILMATNCGDYIFPMDEGNSTSSRFLFEIFDGDGDPAEEAAVFDRYLRGSGLY
ncbi:MAG: hypothetical protein ACSHWY_15250 [Octadecabacter sp.]